MYYYLFFYIFFFCNNSKSIYLIPKLIYPQKYIHHLCVIIACVLCVSLNAIRDRTLS